MSIEYNSMYTVYILLHARLTYPTICPATGQDQNSDTPPHAKASAWERRAVHKHGAKKSCVHKHKERREGKGATRACLKTVKMTKHVRSRNEAVRNENEIKVYSEKARE